MLRDASGHKILNYTEDNNLNIITTWLVRNNIDQQYKIVRSRWIFFQTDHVCTKFSTEFSRIQRIDGQNCAECPYSYNSTLAFQCKTYVHFHKDISAYCLIYMFIYKWHFFHFFNYCSVPMISNCISILRWMHNSTWLRKKCLGFFQTPNAMKTFLPNRLKGNIYLNWMTIMTFFYLFESILNP